MIASVIWTLTNLVCCRPTILFAKQIGDDSFCRLTTICMTYIANTACDTARSFVGPGVPRLLIPSWAGVE